jgi:hypothetical protein
MILSKTFWIFINICKVSQTVEDDCLEPPLQMVCLKDMFRVQKTPTTTLYAGHSMPQA